jgi:hypothetical protein
MSDDYREESEMFADIWGDLKRLMVMNRMLGRMTKDRVEPSRKFHQEMLELESSLARRIASLVHEQ